MSGWLSDLRTALAFAHGHGQRAHGQRDKIAPHGRDHGRKAGEARSARTMRALAWTRAAAHHAQLAKSISSICGSSREVSESKRTSPLSVELSGERSATPVQVARTRPQAGHAHAQMQGQMGEQPFSEKLERAGIRIRAAAHHLGRDCGAGPRATREGRE